MEIKTDKNIYILGDSTSMTVGCENYMYPYLLKEMAIWKKNVNIINYSLAGNTTSDVASLFFIKIKKKLKNNDVIILYLGNCDAASSEIIKGNYNFFQHVKNHIKINFGLKKNKTKIKNKLLYFSWNNNFDDDIEKIITGDTFKYNLRKIIATCYKKKCKVILIKASANENFLPGIGKGNFLFYKYLGLKEKLSAKLMIDDPRFITALEAHESNNYEKALSLYNDILMDGLKYNFSQEYPLIIANNIAVIKSEQKKYEEAIFILELLLKEKKSRKEIIYYNLAEVYKNLRDYVKSEKYKKLSYECDTSLYRIRECYKEKIEEIKSESNYIFLIKMENIVKQNEFLDHCHLILSGQKKLARAIAKVLNGHLFSGKDKAKLKNIIFNPETSKGNFDEFHNYYKTFCPISKKRVSEILIDIYEENQAHGLDKKKLKDIQHPSFQIENAIKYYTKHPIYEVLSDIKKNPPLESYDIGRFPEYFLTRTIIPYLKVFELTEGAIKFDHNLLRKSDSLKSVLPNYNVSRFDKYPDELLNKTGQSRINRILNKCKLMVKEHLKKGNIVDERKKTTIFWYFREALRFGSHSRLSMLYDRITLEFIAEGLAVAFLLNSKWRLSKKKEIIILVNLLNEIVNIHEKFCFSLLNENYDKTIFKEYTKRLTLIRKKLNT